MTETGWLERHVPLDQIAEEARKIRPGRAVLGLIGGVLFAIGWLVARLAGVLWLAATWCFSAVRLGWRQARGQALSQPSLEEALAEIQRLKAEISRMG